MVTISEYVGKQLPVTLKS